MDVEITVGEVAGVGRQAAVFDFLRFARHDPALAGRVVAGEEERPDGAMGGLAIGLKIMGVPARVIASVVVAWLNTYNTDVTVKLTTPDGHCLEVSASRLKRMAAVELPPLVSELATCLEGEVPQVTSGGIRALTQGGHAVGIEAASADGSATPVE